MLSPQYLFGSYAGKFPVHFRSFFRELSRQYLYALTTILFRKICREILCTLSYSFSRVKPAMPVRSHYNSFRELSRQCRTSSLHFLLEVTSGNPLYASALQFLSRVMPVMFVCSHNLYGELCRQCMYALTTTPFESYAGEPVRFRKTPFNPSA